MKITISKSQWQEMGKKAGWMKKANDSDIVECNYCGREFKRDEIHELKKGLFSCDKCLDKHPKSNTKEAGRMKTAMDFGDSRDTTEDMLNSPEASRIQHYISSNLKAWRLPVKSIKIKKLSVCNFYVAVILDDNFGTHNSNFKGNDTKKVRQSLLDSLKEIDDLKTIWERCGNNAIDVQVETDTNMMAMKY